MSTWTACTGPGCKAETGKVKRGCLKCLEGGWEEMDIMREATAPQILHDWRCHVLAPQDQPKLWICEKCAEVFQGDVPGVFGCDTLDYPGDLKLLTAGDISALNGNEVQSEV